ncbi:MAG: GNAT family N-acetyltransferase [Chloroflexi bacterium]|nr:GNAT family N-acetyltransferase [Chloroflexota bacterium]
MRYLEVDHEIVLRIPQFEDAEEYFAVVDSNREYLRQWLGFQPDHVLSVAFTEQMIKRWQKEADESSALKYVIEFRGSIVGYLMIDRLQGDDNLAELSYWLSEDMQGRGIITRSCRVALRSLFEDRQVHRVEIRAEAPNAKSRAVAERLGFTLEGYLREGGLVHGKYYDRAVYSMLVHEWSKA